MFAAEKENAMRKFERRRTFLKFLPAFEALVVVLLLLSWLTPSLSAGEYLRRILSGGLTGGMFTFGVVNVLVALIFSLSNHNKNKKLQESDLYFQYVSSAAAPPCSSAAAASCSSAAAASCSSAAAASCSSPAAASCSSPAAASCSSPAAASCSSPAAASFSSPAAASCSSSAASGVCSSSAALVVSEPTSENVEKILEEKSKTDLTLTTTEEARPTRREMLRAVSSVGETAQVIRRRHEMTFLPAPATRESTNNDHQVYRRSISEKLDVRRDIRRSMRRLCEIDDLSSDEFRSTVETFIAGKKKKMFV